MNLKQTSVSDEETRIISLKYACPQIGTLNNTDMLTATKALLLKIYVITGWIVPSGEIKTALTDQLCKKLQEDYDMMNVEEIEYAFRKSGTTIKDWGKEMNLSLVDEVLIPYLNRRLEASANEEKRKRTPPPQRIYTDEEIMNERREHIELAYQAMRSGRMPIIHDYFAEVLCVDGLISNMRDIDQFFVDMLGRGAENIYIKE